MALIWTIERFGPGELRRWQAVWEATGNIAAAWRCFRLARAWGFPVPQSVLMEFDRIATDFETEVDGVRAGRGDVSIRERPSGLRRETVARILTGAGSGANDPAADLIRWERDFEIAGAVGVLRHYGETEVAAVQRVSMGTDGLVSTLRFEGNTVRMVDAKTPAVSVDVVRRAVIRVRRLTEKTDGYA